jgi:Mg2+ and Co2+ transporter CorA
MNREVFQYGSFGMMMTLLPLLIAAIFLYLFFKKKD